MRASARTRWRDPQAGDERGHAVELLLPYVPLPVLAGSSVPWNWRCPCLSAGWLLLLCRRFMAMLPGTGFNDVLGGDRSPAGDLCAVAGDRPGAMATRPV